MPSDPFKAEKRHDVIWVNDFAKSRYRWKREDMLGVHRGLFENTRMTMLGIIIVAVVLVCGASDHSCNTHATDGTD